MQNCSDSFRRLGVIYVTDLTYKKNDLWSPSLIWVNLFLFQIMPFSFLEILFHLIFWLKAFSNNNAK
jgi:hypothetical protein